MEKGQGTFSRSEKGRVHLLLKSKGQCAELFEKSQMATLRSMKTKKLILAWSMGGQKHILNKDFW